MLFPTDILSEWLVFEKAGIKSGSSVSVTKELAVLSQQLESPIIQLSLIWKSHIYFRLYLWISWELPDMKAWKSHLIGTDKTISKKTSWYA